MLEELPLERIRVKDLPALVGNKGFYSLFLCEILITYPTPRH